MGFLLQIEWHCNFGVNAEFVLAIAALNLVQRFRMQIHVQPVVDLAVQPSFVGSLHSSAAFVATLQTAVVPVVVAVEVASDLACPFAVEIVAAMPDSLFVVLAAPAVSLAAAEHPYFAFDFEFGSLFVAVFEIAADQIAVKLVV